MQSNVKRAAVTIVSRNYLAQARVLSTSFKKQHPEIDFYVYICDRLDSIEIKDSNFTVLHEDVSIPDKSKFFTQYSVMEANTAVKPFVIAHLINILNYDEVVYLDPDILIFRPLDGVWAALDSNDVVLTPHLRNPFKDNKHPRELDILQSGTYNLGFVGFSSRPPAIKILNWWKERLFRDCVVDIPRGLFVDQKWMDLVIGYCETAFVLREPTYNVAYWNLHERELTYNDVYLIDGSPLVFFHFSGFSPFSPHRLSKHENRYRPADYPALERICAEYAELMMRADHLADSQIPYGYGKLPNGIEVSPVLRYAMRTLQDNSLAMPDPWESPHEFADVLMSVDESVCGLRLAPLQKAILKLRPDVAAAYPNVLNNPFDSGFFEWLKNSGAEEEKLKYFSENYDSFREGDLIGELFRCLRVNSRLDVFRAFPNMWYDDRAFDDFIAWVDAHGRLEHGFQDRHISALRGRRDFIWKILGIFLSDSELQKAFDIRSDPSIISFRAWLLENHRALRLDTNAISLFENFLYVEREAVKQLLALYSRTHHFQKPINAFSLMEYSQSDPSIPVSLITEFLSESISSAADQAADYVELVRGGQKLSGQLQELLARNMLRIPEHLGRSVYSFLRSADENMSKKVPINIAGYFGAPTGMGQSARSLSMALKTSGIDCGLTQLPTPFDVDGPLFSGPAKFGWPTSSSNLSIMVANADNVDNARKFVPTNFWSPVNIGYWVWETENFPSAYAQQASLFDEIWTPSAYSALAIQSMIEKPVYIVPHCIDVDYYRTIRGDRAEFGLPRDVLTFGYFYDAHSVMERKNPWGVLKAFAKAFGERSDVRLLLKIQGSTRNLDDISLLEAAKKQSNVIILTETLSSEKTAQLMHCLDVYVSLHRAEGFGLTCAEAMAMAKPVIATQYSGNMDFMSANDSILIPAKRYRTEEAFGPYQKGSIWSEPNLEHAAHAMVQLESRDVRNKIGEAASDAIRQRLAPDAVGRIISDQLKRVAKDYADNIRSRAPRRFR